MAKISCSQTNLVPNPSFETYSACPYALGEIYKAPPWFQASTLPISTDFFHVCSGFHASVPANFCGYQMPSSGSGYAGIILYSIVSSTQFPRPYREYLEVQLLDSLKTGNEYCVEFYLSLANNYNIITDAVGAYFSKDSIKSNDYANLPYTPHIQNVSGNLLSDTTGWMKIQGTFIAQGGEKFITIGNFKNDLNTYADTLSTNASFSYFYIDDISVKEMVPVTADAGLNKDICTSDSILLGTPTSGSVFKYSWSPAMGLSNPSMPQPFAKPISTTTYYLTVTDTAVGCSTPANDSVIITVLPYQTPSANAGISQTICLGDTINIGSLATAGFTYSWSPINYLSDAGSSNPFVFPKQTTLYFLTVTDTASNYLCKTSGTDSVLITIDECPPEIPNVFTPNNDGLNDEFVITSLAEGSSVTIYDRWGIAIWSSSPVGKSGGAWDGRTTSGQACVDGVYFYLVSLSNGEVYKGFVQLLR